MTICLSVILRSRWQFGCQSPSGAGDIVFVSHPPEQATICWSVTFRSRRQFACQLSSRAGDNLFAVTLRCRWQFVCQSSSGAGDNLFVSHPLEQVTICLSVILQTSILFLLNMYYSYVSVTLFLYQFYDI